MEPRSAVGLTARDVRLRRDGRQVLDGARLTLLPGTVTALVAPSGAGKSTLLRCLNRLTRADSGTVRLADRDVATIDPRELRRRVALVVQTPTMLPGTVAENVAYALPRATPGDVEAALRAADLPPAFADRDAAGLSGGERARVAVARALARAPEVLLLDEPTAALDADSAAVIGRTLRRLAEGGLAVCLAVHDLPFARGVADRVVGLDDRELPPGGGARRQGPDGGGPYGPVGGRADGHDDGPPSGPSDGPV